MTCCEDAHRTYDANANREIEVAQLPDEMHVRGKVAFFVFQGPYKDLSAKGWDVFWRKFAAGNFKMEGAPGDVYVCSPGCHKEDGGSKMLTILWAPIA